MFWISMDSFLKIPLCIYASIPMYYTLYKYMHVHGGGCMGQCSQVEPIRDEGSSKGQGKKPGKVMGPASPDPTSSSGTWMTPRSCPPHSKKVRVLYLYDSVIGWGLPHGMGKNFQTLLDEADHFRWGWFSKRGCHSEPVAAWLSTLAGGRKSR